MLTAGGEFEVKIAPLESSDKALGRFSLEKKFHGDLEAVSLGEMLSAGDPKSGSAGYVAIEKIVGTLNGRQGSFCLQHNGTMHAGSQTLEVNVVPGTGTEQLKDIFGRLEIIIKNGKHFYKFDYELPTVQ